MKQLLRFFCFATVFLFSSLACAVDYACKKANDFYTWHSSSLSALGRT